MRTYDYPEVTPRQISALRSEALDAGDTRLAMICDLAQNGDALIGAEPGTDAADLAEEGWSSLDAILEVRRVIAEAAAASES